MITQPAARQSPGQRLLAVVTNCCDNRYCQLSSTWITAWLSMNARSLDAADPGGEPIGSCNAVQTIELAEPLETALVPGSPPASSERSFIDNQVVIHVLFNSVPIVATVRHDGTKAYPGAA